MPETLRLRSAVIVLMLLFFLEPLFAHDKPQDRIDEITLALVHDPENLGLYIERGELYRHASLLDLALSDFHYAAQSDPDDKTVHFHCGRLLFETGQHQQAKITLDLFLGAHPKHVQGLTMRARVLRALKQPLLAVQDYDRALSLVSHPAPVLIIEQAAALVEAGEAYADLAIQRLDAAIEKHGSLVLLESCAIDIEVALQLHHAALARIDRVMQGMARKEKWLVHRGEVLENAGRMEEARAAYIDALEAITSLPARLQQIPASRDLMAYVSDLLERGKL